MFGGWYSARVGGRLVTAPTPMTTDSRHTLYAHWAANTYTVTYRGDDGTFLTDGATADSHHTYDIPSNLTSNGFTRTGYSFAGWTNAYSTIVYTDGQLVENLTDQHEAVVWLYATWAANTNILVTFDSNGGTPDMTDLYQTYDQYYILPPNPVCLGFTFGGWTNAIGERVTATTLMTTATNHTLYAHWDVGPYLTDPAGGAGTSPLLITTAYDGFAYDIYNIVRGTVTLNAKATVKLDKKTGITTTNWTFTAKVALQNATVSFAGKLTGAADHFFAVTRNGEVLDVSVEGDRFYGTVSGGKVGATLTIDGARNAFANKKDLAAQAQLGTLKGVYNVVLVGEETGLQRGYLSLTIGNLGAVKIAGKLDDGTAVSGSAKLLEGQNELGWYAIALHRPLYSKKGFIGGLLWLNPADRRIRVDAGYGWYVDWVCEDPKKETFWRVLDVTGGYFGDGKIAPFLQLDMQFSAYMEDFTAITDAMLPPPWNLYPHLSPPTSGWMDEETSPWRNDTFPWVSLTVENLGLKLALPSASATIAYTAKTGLFKGSFKMYYGGYTASGSLQHKTLSVPYSGVMIPGGDGLLSLTCGCEPVEPWVPSRDILVGAGFGTATINKQNIPIPISLGADR
ncbi:MAG: InlB B-repeat-containing protein [Kiritimatiellaeota bacterium]|nr:InlB B-repeat-containing protein [Kiritimatiellota bacterium]